MNYCSSSIICCLTSKRRHAKSSKDCTQTSQFWCNHWPEKLEEFVSCSSPFPAPSLWEALQINVHWEQMPCQQLLLWPSWPLPSTSLTCFTLIEHWLPLHVCPSLYLVDSGLLCTFIMFLGFFLMKCNVNVYYVLYVYYMFQYVLCGSVVWHFVCLHV